MQGQLRAAEAAGGAQVVPALRNSKNATGDGDCGARIETLAIARPLPTRPRDNERTALLLGPPRLPETEPHPPASSGLWDSRYPPSTVAQFLLLKWVTSPLGRCPPRLPSPSGFLEGQVSVEVASTAEYILNVEKTNRERLGPQGHLEPPLNPQRFPKKELLTRWILQFDGLVW